MSRSAIQECLEDITENPRHEVSIIDFIKVLPPAGDGHVPMAGSVNPVMYKSARSDASTIKAPIPKRAESGAKTAVLLLA